jgi:putative hydrolase of the HAD superfamily
MIKTIKTILFDLDDTLIVERKSAEESFRETIASTKIKLDYDLFAESIFKTAKEEWYKLPTIDFCLRIGISSWEGLWGDFTGEGIYFSHLRQLAAKYRFDVWNNHLKKFGIEDEKLALQLGEDFKRIRNTKHVLFEETIEILNQLKNRYQLGLITNGAPDIQWKKINGGRLASIFETIIISGEHGFAKPDSRLFEIALKRLNTVKESTVMIGDSLEKDIQGAHDFGLKTIWVNRKGITDEFTTSDYEVSDLSQLIV